MNRFRKFMLGRYGMDQLSMVLLIFSVLLALTSQITGLPSMALISYLPLMICIYRMLSKNIGKRSMENYKFFMFISPLYSWFQKKQGRIKTVKTHRYFKCPNCKATLRLPKGKGRIIITCPKCRTKFEKKT